MAFRRAFALLPSTDAVMNALYSRTQCSSPVFRSSSLVPSVGRCAAARLSTAAATAAAKKSGGKPAVTAGSAKPAAAARGAAAATLSGRLVAQLDDMRRRHDAIVASLSSEAASRLGGDELRRSQRELQRLRPVLDAVDALQRLHAELEGSERFAAAEPDPELAALARQDVARLREEAQAADHRVLLAMLPTDEDDQRNAILEIRPGTGGEEAALFAQEMFRMYQRYAESRRWRFEPISMQASEAGGLKEASAMVQGTEAFGRLRHESGVHRVQRVPQTERDGRVHTSTVSVAVLPEAHEVDVRLLDSELRIDSYRSSGNGGQSVNTTDSAVRVTHLPTGLVVAIQDERSQHKNKSKALSVLRSRLYELERQRQHDQRAAERNQQVGTGGRSERVRTYNFAQDRVTDHRSNTTVHDLAAVLDGELDELLEAKMLHDQEQEISLLLSAQPPSKQKH